MVQLLFYIIYIKILYAFVHLWAQSLALFRFSTNFSAQENGGFNFFG